MKGVEDDEPKHPVDHDQQGFGSDGEEVDEAFNIAFSQMIHAEATGSQQVSSLDS